MYSKMPTKRKISIFFGFGWRSILNDLIKLWNICGAINFEFSMFSAHLKLKSESHCYNKDNDAVLTRTNNAYKKTILMPNVNTLPLSCA